MITNLIARGGATHGAEPEVLEPSSDLYVRGQRGITYIRACYCIALLLMGSFENPVLVLTFWIGSQIVEKHLEKGIFSKL